MRGLLVIAGAGGLLVFGASASAAVMLPDGADVVPDTQFSAGNVVIAPANPVPNTIVSTFNVSLDPGYGQPAQTLTGTVTSWAVQDTANSLGGLSFYYLVTNGAGTQPIDGFTVRNFSGFQTSVTSIPIPAAGFTPLTNGVAPSSADRSGGIIGFDFMTTGAGMVVPGASSRLLVVHTNAPDFTVGTSGITDGLAGSAVILAPVPEPGALVVLGLAAGSLLIRRRR